MAADVTVALFDGVLRIEGTAGDDAIFVRQEGDAVAVDYSSGLNTVGRVTFPAGVQKIEARSGDGRDLIVLHVESLASRTMVDTGPNADLVLSKLPIEVRSSGRDLFVPLVDASLPMGNDATTRRSDGPNIAHEAVYVGQSLTASRTWTADGRHVEITFDGQGSAVRSTSLGDHVILHEIWGATGGYLRIVNGLNGTVLRETFLNGVLQLEERQRDGQLIRTAWDKDGYTLRQSLDGDRRFLEEAWDPQGGYRRAWVDDSGRTIKEVFEAGTLRLKTVTKAGHRERSAWDAAGNRAREVFAEGVIVRLDQWDTDGVRRTTRYTSGLPGSRKTFKNDRLVQQEVWTEGQLINTAWNETGDRIVQTFVGETKIREEEIRSSGERRVTESKDGQVIRTVTDTAGNAVAERLAGDRVLSRTLQAADGSRVVTTLDPGTAEPLSEERISADGRQVWTTTWTAETVVRQTRRDGAVILRERWRGGEYRRTSGTPGGDLRVERFVGADRTALTEGSRASETITTADGTHIETVWEPDGTRRLTSRQRGVTVFEEVERNGTLTRTALGDDGVRQEETSHNGVRMVVLRFPDGRFSERRFAGSDEPFYEHVQIDQSTSQTTTLEWGGHYGADRLVTVLTRDGDKRVKKTTDDRGNEDRLFWFGSGDAPGATFLQESDYKTNGWGMPLSHGDVAKEVLFYENGRIVYHEQSRVDRVLAAQNRLLQQVLKDQNHPQWQVTRRLRYSDASLGNVFSLSYDSSPFNLWNAQKQLEHWKGIAEGAGKKVSDATKATIRNIQTAFSGIDELRHAIHVNVRTIQGDLTRVLSPLDPSKLKFPQLDDVRIEGINFKPSLDFKWQPIKFNYQGFLEKLPKRPIDVVVGVMNVVRDIIIAPIKVLQTIVRQVAPATERKIELRTRGWRYMEAGYSQEQGDILYDLMDRATWEGGRGLRGRYLDEFRSLLAHEGQKIYQLYLESDGGELDAAGHARLQEIAGGRAQSRLLARYGLNPDGTRIPRSGTPGVNLSDSGSRTNPGDPRFDPTGGADGSGKWWFPDVEITPSKPAKDRKQPPNDGTGAGSDQTDDASDDAEEAIKRQREFTERNAATRRRIAYNFPEAISTVTTSEVKQYAGQKGKVVVDFYDNVEQKLRIGGAFAAGLGSGATATVEGLAKGMVAALDSDAWRNLGQAVREKGRNFMQASNKAEFIADFGERTYTSFEESVVKSIAEWERSSPEGRARMLGEIAGQLATEAVLGGVAGKMAGTVGDVAKIGGKTNTAVDKTISSPGFGDYEKKVKAAAGRNQKDPESLLKAHDKVAAESLAKQLHEQSGMVSDHARKISEFAKDRKQLIVIRSSNPKSLQYHGKNGFSAKPGDLKLKTNRDTGLVTATKRRDGALIDARGDVVDGFQVAPNGWIVNTKELVNGKPTRTNYRLDKGHVVDAKGNKFFSDYDVLSIDEEPLNGTGWQMVSTGDAKTGPGQVIHDLNRAVSGNDRSRDMFKHGANRENYAKKSTGIYQIATPEVGERFTVFDSDGTIFVVDGLYVKRLMEGRAIPTDDVLPWHPGVGI